MNQPIGQTAAVRNVSANESPDILMLLRRYAVLLAAGTIAGAGIAGVALGFGAQSLVKDFLSGMFMLMENQYDVGDVIDTGVATGTVEGVMNAPFSVSRARYEMPKVSPLKRLPCARSTTT